MLLWEQCWTAGRGSCEDGYIPTVLVLVVVFKKAASIYPYGVVKLFLKSGIIKREQIAFELNNETRKCSDKSTSYFQSRSQLRTAARLAIIYSPTLRHSVCISAANVTWLILPLPKQISRFTCPWQCSRPDAATAYSRHLWQSPNPFVWDNHKRLIRWYMFVMVLVACRDDTIMSTLEFIGTV